ncbi:MAG: hypothetical protein LBJ76_05375, partial [Candidatus Accumulibacter sp.]|nr:hypothetical protein [Accumulibacter sp.]
MVAWFVYFYRSLGLVKTKAERTVILAAEGRVTNVNLTAGEIDISYTSGVPDCYPFFGSTKVSNPGWLKDIKKDDLV